MSRTLTGSGPPEVSTGVAGDLYLDTLNQALYGPKPSSGPWPAGVPLGGGTEGPMGPQGPQGPPGADGAPGGPVGPAGPAGPAGATGAQGTQGPQGLKGDRGLPGADGAQGPAGNDGLPGAAGAAGSQGPQGIQGPAGLPGADGAQGIQGPAGNDGAPGATGAQGPQGIQGPAGLPGADGAQGIQGPPGNDGLPGAQGIQGPQGDQGIQGPPGNDGLPGAAGAAGAAGADGAQGIQGIQGPAGNDGAPGTPGADGAQGPPGSNGSNGVDGLGYGGYSTTSLTLGTGAQVLDLSSAAFAYQTGTRVRLGFDSANYMEGVVSSLVGVSLTVSISHVVGSGTYGFWYVSLAGDVGAAGAAGANGAAGATGAAGAGYGGTSSSSVALGLGSKTFTTQAGLAYQANDVVRVSNSTSAYMVGMVASYTGTTLVVMVGTVLGSGTYASWTIGLSAVPTMLIGLVLPDNVTSQTNVSTALTWDVGTYYAVRLTYALRRGAGPVYSEVGTMNLVMNTVECLCEVLALTTSTDPGATFYGSLSGSTASLQYKTGSTGSSVTLDILSIDARNY